MGSGTFGFNGLLSRGFDLPSGSIVEVGKPGRARLRYNELTNELEVSKNGAAYVVIGGGGGASPWTDTGTLLHPTTTSRSVVVGASALDGSEQLRVVGEAVHDGNITFEDTTSGPTIGQQDRTDGSAGETITIQGQGNTAASTQAGGVSVIAGDHDIGDTGAGGDVLLQAGSGIGGFGSTAGSVIARLGTGTENSSIFVVQNSAFTNYFRVGGTSTVTESLIPLHARNTLSISSISDPTDNYLAFADGTGAPTSSSGFVSLRNNGGVFEVSQDTGAYTRVVVEALADNDPTALRFHEGANDYIVCDTTNGSEQVVLSAGGGPTVAVDDNGDIVFEKDGSSADVYVAAETDVGGGGRALFFAAGDGGDGSGATPGGTGASTGWSAGIGGSGTATAAAGRGGDMDLNAGGGGTNDGGGGNIGGNFSAQAGNGSRAFAGSPLGSVGGVATFFGGGGGIANGAGLTPGTGGVCEIRGGSSGATLGGANATGVGGQLNLLGGQGTGTGGNVLVTGGKEHPTGGVATGGNVVIDGGPATTNGNVLIGTVSTVDVSICGATTNLGFFGTTPAPQSAAYTRTATIVESRTLAANVSATATNNNAVLAALIADLQAYGLLG
jgi:hypothetical protein